MTVAARNLAASYALESPVSPTALLDGPLPPPAVPEGLLAWRARLEAREAALDAREADLRQWEALRRLAEPGTWPLPRTSVLWAFERAIAAWGLTREEWIAIGQRAYRRTA